jgi:hypothetical protein
MARRGGRVQLQQSDMRLGLNMAKLAKEGFSRAPMEATKYLIMTPCTEVREEKTLGVVFPGHKMVKASIQRHPAMLRPNQTSFCVPCQNGPAKNPQIRWRCKATGAPPPARRRERIPEPTPPPPPAMPPTSTRNPSGDQPAKIFNLPAR